MRKAELFCRDGGVNIYPVLRQVCRVTDCRSSPSANVAQMTEKQETQNITPAELLHMPWGSVEFRKEGFFLPGSSQVSVRESWSLDWGLRCLFSSRAMTTSKNAGNEWYETVFSKKGQMAMPNINIEASRFFQIFPSPLPWMCPNLQRTQFSKGMLIVPDTTESAVAYPKGRCV